MNFLQDIDEWACCQPLLPCLSCISDSCLEGVEAFESVQRSIFLPICQFMQISFKKQWEDEILGPFSTSVLSPKSCLEAQTLSLSTSLSSIWIFIWLTILGKDAATLKSCREDYMHIQKIFEELNLKCHTALLLYNWFMLSVDSQD